MTATTAAIHPAGIDYRAHVAGGALVAGCPLCNSPEAIAARRRARTVHQLPRRIVVSDVPPRSMLQSVPADPVRYVVPRWYDRLGTVVLLVLIVALLLAIGVQLGELYP